MILDHRWIRKQDIKKQVERAVMKTKLSKAQMKERKAPKVRDRHSPRQLEMIPQIPRRKNWLARMIRQKNLWLFQRAIRIWKQQN